MAVYLDTSALAKLYAEEEKREDLAVPLGKDVLPVSGYALSEERGGVLLAGLAAFREFLKFLV